MSAKNPSLWLIFFVFLPGTRGEGTAGSSGETEATLLVGDSVGHHPPVVWGCSQENIQSSRVKCSCCFRCNFFQWSGKITRRGHFKEIGALGLKQQGSPMRPLFSGRRVHPFVSESLQQPTGGGSPSCHYFFMPLRWQTSPVEQHFSVSILLILMTRWIFLSQRIRATWLEKESSQWEESIHTMCV